MSWVSGHDLTYSSFGYILGLSHTKCQANNLTNGKDLSRCNRDLFVCLCFFALFAFFFFFGEEEEEEEDC